jgi:hypothetical protein
MEDTIRRKVAGQEVRGWEWNDVRMRLRKDI